MSGPLSIGKDLDRPGTSAEARTRRPGKPGDNREILETIATLHLSQDFSLANSTADRHLGEIELG